ncbi:MAG: ATP-binding cassette domain-containing protein [Clostridiaceae bacterium]
MKIKKGYALRNIAGENIVAVTASDTERYCKGQVQRLAIARAVLSDAPILLLDECTSALDEVTEARVLKNIKALKTKTVIYISHKEATLNSCDRIIYM